MMQRVSWKQLQNTVFARHPIVQNMYEQQRNIIQDKYHSYSDMIKIKYMNFGARNKQGKIYSVKTTDSLDIAFTQNIYPYHLAKNIHHYIIWSVRPLSNKAIDAYMNNNIVEIYNIKDYVLMVNNTSRCSVPDLWHCHVFWK
jgi:hypothetical protein